MFIDLVTFMKDYWFLVLIAIAVVSIVSINLYNWFKKPTAEQLEKVRQWLVFAVAKAEEVLGSGTGQLKLKYVYDMFLTKFPAIGLFISYEQFCQMVEEALAEFKEMLEKNEKIGALYINEGDE